jgi:CubicO group peptidase (beta-lactamase class C family)
MPRALAAVLVGGLLLAPATLHAQQSDFLTGRFAAYLEALRRQAGIPGMSAAIVQDGVIVWEAGFGQQDLEQGRPATPDTPYYLGDLTQTFTATLVLACAEEGKLVLESPVQVEQPGATAITATVRQLLRHVRPSDGAFEYDPARFTALTQVVSQCADESYRGRLAQAVLDRLAMTRSIPGLDAAAAQPPEFAPERLAGYAALVPEVARPYRVDDSGHATATSFPPQGLNAAAGLVSTVRDLARFDAALDDLVLLRSETLAAAWTPAADGANHPFGLGWFTQLDSGEPVVWHFGYTPDVSSALLLKLPNRRTTFILLANSDGLSAHFPLAEGDVNSSPFARLFLSAVR